MRTHRIRNRFNCYFNSEKAVNTMRRIEQENEIAYEKLARINAFREAIHKAQEKRDAQLMLKAF